jgi:hypothetical protein
VERALMTRATTRGARTPATTATRETGPLGGLRIESHNSILGMTHVRTKWHESERDAEGSGAGRPFGTT